MDAAAELIVRKAIANQAGLVASVGYVTPSPLYFSESADWWATTDAAKNTRKEIDQEPIAGLWIYPLQFVDDFTSGGQDSPLVNVIYEFYLFRQYALDRGDESDTPELFESQCLVQHNKFVEAWLGLKESFQGNRNIAGLDPEVFVTVKTSSLVQNEFIANQAPCEFVPGAVGFAVRLQCTVKVKLKAC